MVNKSKQVICLMGPTASGKTNLAVDLVAHLPLDIISVDSAMVYRTMDIGTAKPSKEIQAKAPHRLIDICDPTESYSAGQFCQDARVEIDKIHAESRIPLLVGGTMLYFNLFQRGFSEFPSSNPEIREKISAHAHKLGWEKMHERLQLIDPKAASQIHPNDPQRIGRALELYEMTGQTMTELQAQQVWQESPFHIINIVLSPPDRALVHKRIEQRVDEMLNDGLVQEVERLYLRGDLTAEMPSMRMLNYRQVWAYLDGHLTQAQMRERAIVATRQFAKRQFTWLRRWNEAQVFDSEDREVVTKVKKFLDDCRLCAN